MDTFIQTISFETKLRLQKNKEYISELKKFGAQKRVETGVYETSDSRDSIFNYDLNDISIETLSKFLILLDARYNAQCEWVRICNSKFAEDCGAAA